MEGLWAHAIESNPLAKLLLALLLSGLIGLEREWHGRAAGLRTHVLVCLGSTILLIAARSASSTFAVESGVGTLVTDPNRIAAGIVTGIGFLGAGAMLRTGDLIRGLTTAACIWFVAALGIVIGNGLFALGAVSTLIVLLVLILFDVLEHWIPPVVYRALTVRIASGDREEFETWCRKRLLSSGMRIQEILSRIDSTEGLSEVIFRIRARGTPRTGGLIEEISSRPGVRHVRWDQA